MTKVECCQARAERTTPRWACASAPFARIRGTLIPAHAEQTNGWLAGCPAAFVFLALLILTSTYLYSKRFAGLINSLLVRLNLIA